MKNLFVITMLILIAGCTTTETVEVKDEQGQVTESFQIDKTTKQKEGTYRRFNAGILVEEANYQADTLQGLRLLYFDNGGKEIEEEYRQGLHHGMYKTYYQDGALKLAGFYTDGVMDSIWTKYYPAGQIMEKVQMRDNNENGPFVEYYENGKLKAEGTYLDGDNEHGELLLYDENGVLERKMECDKGICHTTWSKEKAANED